MKRKKNIKEFFDSLSILEGWIIELQNLKSKNQVSQLLIG